MSKCPFRVYAVALFMFLSSLLVTSLFKRAPKAVLEGWPVLLNRGSV